MLWSSAPHPPQPFSVTFCNDGCAGNFQTGPGFFHCVVLFLLFPHPPSAVSLPYALRVLLKLGSPNSKPKLLASVSSAHPSLRLSILAYSHSAQRRQPSLRVSYLLRRALHISTTLFAHFSRAATIFGPRALFYSAAYVRTSPFPILVTLPPRGSFSVPSRISLQHRI